ncbi:polyprenyl synthetase family protein [Ornithinimicrobium sp. INDO-MA30-4]|uniref:polyprenyl synthetase family protein n=1 Tax=Ornithinimicrobium sp. INDO-MA30-4 TaxID=2908651 RepID=UPI001F2B4D57|nr:polyprenyl synthetase family protein [Ornithinimicrobium sp. INDO-MA30-4]UJH71297.1 polyprenyl synthetase family protein [Ornithinimicrobium sp. INDO-MA30-4]
MSSTERTTATEGTPTTGAVTSHPLASVNLHQRVQAALDVHISAQREVLAELGPEVSDLVDAVASLLAGGKRLRAGFLYWGYRAFNNEDSDELVACASALEVFQAAALLHDDVMDKSDTRRGKPTAHRAFAAQHQAAGWQGDPEDFGRAAAILAGDMCLNWCDEIYTTSGMPSIELARARPTFDLMRTQLMAGQYLDVLHSMRDWADLNYEQRIAQSRAVIRYKSAKYTIEHPLLIGAQAAGAPPEAIADLSTYGMALGEAFQLRDDVLGVYGNPESTGKPAGDDLREGKRTVLIAHALEHSNTDDCDFLLKSLGQHDLSAVDVERCREILIHSGAVERTEEMISEQSDIAAESLSRITQATSEGLDALHSLIDISTARAT